VYNSYIPVRAFSPSWTRRENNFTSSNQIYIFRNSGLHATEYPYKVTGYIGCNPAFLLYRAMKPQGRQSIPNVGGGGGGGGTDSKLGRSGAMLPETCFLILVH
jgi:hypothetical protein